ncbi:D-alanyl-D-alanine carboxypeptidase family protein [Ornithinibacillus contaminans]|uniref:D-alanyl-D-alanine carboxypeptidase family protein n=1 Tax=Ornithinibacillus contaminans TaxID=694055 RepID=UPI00069D04C5|nr:D-alanyl-D-alanine carboxypeptidase family protein [Ornithinibacillus contaminans]
MKKMGFILTNLIVLNLLLPIVTFGHSNTSPPSLNSEAAIIIEAKSGAVIYEENSNAKMYPASLTKIATAIYAIENGNLDEVVTVSENARGTVGSSVYLEEGEKITLLQLVQGLLVNSGNDAGVAIAEHLSGSTERFSHDINEYLENKIGVQNTNFVNPHGLFNTDHLTTAEDLAKITQYAIENETFKEIFALKEVNWDGETWDTTLYTHHKLMREIPYEGITGGKTGFVEESGYTLATTAERDNLSLIIITLNSEHEMEAYTDTTNLLNYAFENYKTSKVSAGTTFKVENKEYQLSKDYYYTHLINEQVKFEANNSGVLNIITEENEILASTQLSSTQVEELANNTTQGKNDIVKGNNKESSIFLFSKYMNELIYIVLMLSFGILGLVYYQNRKVL